MPTIKDPTYNVFKKGGNVEKKMSSGGSELPPLDMKQFIKLARETPEEEFELDWRQRLSEFPSWKKENPDKTYDDFLDEKGIRRIQLGKGGKVILLSDYLKQKEEPRIKKINIAQGDFTKTVAGLSDKDKDMIKDLLRKSGVLVGD